MIKVLSREVYRSEVGVLDGSYFTFMWESVYVLSQRHVFAFSSKP